MSAATTKGGRASARPLFSLEPGERHELASTFVGLDVELDYSPHRLEYDYTTERGKLLAVARPLVGTVADVAVLLRSGSIYPIAISLATVRAIRPALDDFEAELAFRHGLADRISLFARRTELDELDARAVSRTIEILRRIPK